MNAVTRALLEFYTEREYYINCGFVDMRMFVERKLDLILLSCFILRQVGNIGEGHIMNKEIMEKLKEFSKNGYIKEIELANLSNDFLVEKGRNIDVVNTWQLNEFKKVERRNNSKRTIVGDILMAPDFTSMKYNQELVGFGPLGKDVNYFVPISIFLMLKQYTQEGQEQFYIDTIKILVQYCITEIEQGNAFGSQQLQAANKVYMATWDKYREITKKL
jgi:hypothetical protein